MCDIAVFGGNVDDEGYYEGRDAVADLQFIPFGKSECHLIFHPTSKHHWHMHLHGVPL